MYVPYVLGAKVGCIPVKVAGAFEPVGALNKTQLKAVSRSLGVLKRASKVTVSFNLAHLAGPETATGRGLAVITVKELLLSLPSLTTRLKMYGPDLSGKKVKNPAFESPSLNSLVLVEGFEANFQV